MTAGTLRNALFHARGKFYGKIHAVREQNHRERIDGIYPDALQIQCDNRNASADCGKRQTPYDRREEKRRLPEKLK